MAPRQHFTPLERLALALGLLLMIAITGTVGFIILDRLSVIDALYMTLITISTLGMKATTSEAISTAGKIWVMFLIVVGGAAAMVALTLLVGVVVEGHVRSILGRRKVNKQIATSENHIIVCGYGRMGRSICQRLRQSRSRLVVIDQNTQKTAQAEKDGCLYVLGDASEESVLRDAGIERAGGLVAVLDTDAANVYVTLIARGLNPQVFIAARAEQIESESRLLRAGANKAICPQVIGAARIANILTRPGVVDFMDFASEGLDLEAEQYHLSAQNKLVGQTLRQANLPSQAGVLVVALKRRDNQTIFNPGPDTVLQADDVMIITGRSGSLARLAKLYP